MSETVDTVRLAKILDVSKNTVSKAIANGRLKKSVRKVGTKYEIDLVTAILEFYQNADLSKIKIQEMSFLFIRKTIISLHTISD